MIQLFRDHLKSWLSIIIIVFIILTFALWGVQRLVFNRGKETVVAKVNGSQITQHMLLSRYQQLQSQIKMAFGDNRPVDANLNQQLKKQALQSIIEKLVLLKHAIHQGYYIGQVELEQAIVTMPVFSVKGHFSKVRFNQLIHQLGMTPNQFFQQIKEELLVKQLQRGIVDSAFVPAYGLQNHINAIIQKRNFYYTELKSSYFSPKINIKDKAVNDYYHNHANDFKLAEKISIGYIEVSLKQLAQQINPTKPQLVQFYQQNQQLFAKKSYKAAENQVKQAYIEQTAKKQFTSTINQLSDLIYEYPTSLEPIATKLQLKLHHSHLFSRNGPHQGILQIKAVVDAAFSDAVLQRGNNSDVIRLDHDHVVVLRLDKHQPEQLKPFKEVKQNIITKLKQQQARVNMKAVAEKIVDNIKDKKRGQGIDDQTLLNQLTQQYPLHWQSSGLIAKGSAKINPLLVEAGFLLPLSTPTKLSAKAVSLTKDRYGIIVLKEVSHDPSTNGLTDQQKQGLSQSLAAIYGNSAYQLYQQHLVNTAKIRYYHRHD